MFWFEKKKCGCRLSFVFSFDKMAPFFFFVLKGQGKGGGRGGVSRIEEEIQSAVVVVLGLRFPDVKVASSSDSWWWCGASRPSWVPLLASE